MKLKIKKKKKKTNKFTIFCKFQRFILISATKRTDLRTRRNRFFFYIDLPKRQPFYFCFISAETASNSSTISCSGALVSRETTTMAISAHRNAGSSS